MECKKCARTIPEDAALCCYCGARIQPKKPGRGGKKRANGMGTARKRGSTWTAISPPKPMLVDGKVVYRPITKGGFRTKTEALLAAPTLGVRARDDHSRITFTELYSRWLKQHEGRVSRSTMDCYKAAYKYYRDIHLAPFTMLVTADWQACVDDCTQGRRTKENMKALGTQLYKYAAAQDITQKNFAQYIYIGHGEQVSRNAFAREEIRLILDKAMEGVPFADYIACGCYLGFRPTALFAIKKADYDPVERTIRGGIKTDAGRDRIVPVSPRIQPLIDRLMGTDSEWLFPNPEGGQFTTDNFRKDYFYACLDQLGIQPKPQPGETPKYTPYSWRHSFFTMLARVEGAEKVKAELGGHTSYEMSKHYQHPDLADKRAITDALAA